MSEGNRHQKDDCKKALSVGACGLAMLGMLLKHVKIKTSDIPDSLCSTCIHGFCILGVCCFKNMRKLSDPFPERCECYHNRKTKEEKPNE